MYSIPAVFRSCPICGRSRMSQHERFLYVHSILSCVISGFYLEVDENYAFLGYYVAGNDNSGQPIGHIFKDSRPLKIGRIGCPETSVRNYHNLLRNSPEKRSSQVYFYFVTISHNLSV